MTRYTTAAAIVISCGLLFGAPAHAQTLSPSDPGFWVVLPDGARVPYNHPLASGRSRRAAPAPRPQPAPAAPGRVLTPSDPGFWVTLPDGGRVPYNHPLVAGSDAPTPPPAAAPAPADPEPAPGAVLSPSDPGFWVRLANGALVPYNHPDAINARAPAQRPSPRPSPSPSPSPSPAPAPAPAPEPEPDPEPSVGAATLKVLHWNIHHGVGTDGRYDINRFVTWMARWRPDIVSINEAEKNTYWGREDQPARFRSLLEQATGQRWYAHFAQEYGDWSANGKGNLILSRFPFVSTAREVLSWDRTMAIATVVVNGRNVTVVSTHLDPESRDRRLAQARQVISQAAQFGDPRIICGDFNAWPDQTAIGAMTGAYYDSWAVGEGAGRASSFRGNSPFGATKNGRIDYVFYSRGAASVLRVVRVQVPDTRDSSGRMPSDHRPVLTTFEVR